ncbi:bacillithiol biosynthesis deacetylase BshB2 [Caldibacillus lycopersici]|uniref:Bacillithiol biosynthesis deacetylase BshB2 n=1 Tax=Perspicuibacillus lycopersici TaxID=1325689 RepID=A0AAE3IS16_9BACI|nr:bacillithiol biosynthesis deacetylase BshB2 [Perspicuibacillus lycopersici]MCU9613357.1 bacillithiol biosynthesis deacetylase BshB2 [Perspicuibacillus lycopersici]
MESERHVLVIFPHPDDEAFGVSGTIATLIKNGTPVTYACLTLGQMGRNLGNPPFATRETLPLIRKKELQDAAAAMGIKDLRMLGFHDKTVEFEDEEKLADLFSEMIAELNPSLVITFYPGYSVHPDHEATGRAVIRSIGRLDKSVRPKVHCVAFSNNCEEELGKPDIVHDISAVAEQKLATMRAHRSQTALFMEDMENRAAAKDPETLDRLHFERFWTYQWND